jgi:hypothetical protein
MDTISEEQLVLSLGDFRAKTYQPQAKELDLMAKDPVYTGKCLELLASVCPDTQFLKTSQASLLETQVGGSQNFSMTWTRSGLMQSGIVSRLDTLAQRIDGTGCGLLPTPTVSDSKGTARNRFLGSPTCHSNLGEHLRKSVDCPTLHSPLFVEQMMGFPVGWTESD